MLVINKSVLLRVYKITRMITRINWTPLSPLTSIVTVHNKLVQTILLSVQFIVIATATAAAAAAAPAPAAAAAAAAAAATARSHSHLQQPGKVNGRVLYRLSVQEFP